MPMRTNLIPQMAERHQSLKAIFTALTIAVLISLVACQHGVQSSANQNANRAEDDKNPELSLLHKYGWTVVGEPADSTIELPAPIDRLLVSRLRLSASKRIGLDFGDQAGKTLAVRTYKVTNDAERGHEIRAYLLLSGTKVVGAWLSVAGKEGEELAPNIYALNVNPHKPK